MTLRVFLAAAAVLTLAAPAVAQDKPLMTPTKDVAVTYKTVGRDAGQTMTISYSADARLMRIDANGMPGYVVVDRDKQRSMMVMPDQKMYMEMNAAHAPPGTGLPDDANANLTKKGTDTVAGIACTVWAAQTPHGPGEACITADGVMLRATGKDGAGLEATQVSYSAQPAANFAPPAGFQKMDMPAMPPGGAMPGGPPRR